VISKSFIRLAFAGLMVLSSLASAPAHALQLDWNGQFWFDNHWLNNYQLDRSRPGYDADPDFVSAGGPYVPGVGEKNVVWYSAFLRLQPKAIVNDSVSIRSEFHIGSPIYNFLGRGFPSGSGDERLNFTGAQKDSLSIAAQRFWANIVTDFGTIELGRAPIHWGLGAIWNSGDRLFDRYQSTGDMIRLTTKFGNFSIQPSLVKIAAGNNAGGASVSSSNSNGLTLAGNAAQGNDDITDYNVAVKYDNSEEDFELGMMWTRRTGNVAQKSLFFNPQQSGSTRINYNLFDFSARKKLGRFYVGGELPLFSGDLGALDGRTEFTYKAFAIVAEAGYTSDVWDVNLKAGHVPGQPSTPSGDNKFKAIYLHKNYDLGLILFNYNLYGLGLNNPDSVTGVRNSPYDGAIVNATYVALSPEAKLDKWTLRPTLVFAWADEVARSGNQFYNHQRRQFFNAVNNQSKFIGWEGDFAVGFRWDDNITLGWDLGVFFPGEYFAFSNVTGVPTLNTSFMYASQARVGISF